MKSPENSFSSKRSKKRSKPRRKCVCRLGYAIGQRESRSSQFVRRLRDPSISRTMLGFEIAKQHPVPTFPPPPPKEGGKNVDRLLASTQAKKKREFFLLQVGRRHSGRRAPRNTRGAMCVQKLDDSLVPAIRITYRISLRSSSSREPRHPP